VKSDGYVPQGQGAFETQKRRHPRLHQTARLRGLGGSAEVSRSEIGAIYCNPKSIFGPTVEGQDERHKRIAVISIQASSVTMSR
jgi:hypothetical protein